MLETLLYLAFLNKFALAEGRTVIVVVTYARDVTSIHYLRVYNLFYHLSFEVLGAVTLHFYRVFSSGHHGSLLGNVIRTSF